MNFSGEIIENCYDPINIRQRLDGYGITIKHMPRQKATKTTITEVLPIAV